MLRSKPKQNPADTSMPKKTKKQKLRAEKLRQTQFQISMAGPVKPQVGEAIPSPEISLPVKAELKEKTVGTAQTINTGSADSHVKKDLLKISLFTVFALVIQVVLYYLLRG
ncbi:MAG: hypothetical protein UV73_C0012G0136 [Candidatus Gottesmanbacteria bacterium GW2011_GWA2_43_14]|uniref:Uncharacterized protein n=1 Tax=Candidatus Gottesmanbacteria bacterium GW2011_GWA2_43_14 TaxID=1618443 RepID=A0A0G1GB03_9BACT|nr:MAG: hypothetical protein UV73_C0012G0136 [Candidatus Gottesmanbacteria bacterium GW2011_GWA2_43_14]